MNVFFDNCTSPVLAATLNGFLPSIGHAAFHIKDLPCGRDATDIAWITMLADDPARWIVITGDGRIRRNPPERAAFRQSGLCGFVLAPRYQKTRVQHQAAFLLWRWDDIKHQADLISGAALFELPMHRTAKLSALPL